jgi:hypothetical protein
MSPPAPTLRALVSGLVDYAGLFPPASLGMAEAVANYAVYRAAPEAWMLGRLVVPVSRLADLEGELAGDVGGAATAWRVAAIGSGDPAADGDVVRRFNERHAGRIAIDVVEHRVASIEAVHAAARATPADVTLYAELPLAAEPRPLLAAVREARARAKARTGGITTDAFPTAEALARFIVRCAEMGVAFKATAGLHHPLRAEHALTYAPDAPRGTMFGFLNVFGAAAFASAGMTEATIARVLEERDPSAFVFGDEALEWRGHQIALERLTAARASLAIAFGSCSFREPVDDLHRLHLIGS